MRCDREIDAGRPIDWGRIADEYDRYRPGPPDSFYERLRAMDVGLSGQRFLDLGAGTGAMARRFAANGCHVVGVDISLPSLVQAAQEQRAPRHLHGAQYVAACAEAPPFRDDTFDVVMASQCWLYFDKARTVPEVRRVLKPEGVLVTSHLSFMPRHDEIVRQSEALVLRRAHWSSSSSRARRWRT